MAASRPLLVLTVLIGLIASGCGGEGQRDDDGRLLVLATTTVLGDVVGNVVGDHARVEVLIPVGADSHDFQASAAQIAQLNRADLVVANGLGLEEGLESPLDVAAADGVAVLEVGPLVDPVPLRPEAEHEEEHEVEEGEEEEHERGGLDSHVWLDPLRMAVAARLMAARLAEIDPATDWMTRAEEYAAELAVADEAIAARLSTIPEDDRRLVTNHESLGYFARRYGFEVVGVVIPGGSTLGDPSSAHLAELVEVMRREGVRVIFGETVEPGALAAAVASELGGDVEVVPLFTESLGEPGSEADTLIGMLKTNAARIAEALGRGR
ncbi:MAG: metal ABC transporter substrate-binding protein [Actinobacteria bacterium]|nr:metal ABC transporter substrate-binding protein [Actinomycetota bacterium]